MFLDGNPFLQNYEAVSVALQEIELDKVSLVGPDGPGVSTNVTFNHVLKVKIGHKRISLFNQNPGDFFAALVNNAFPNLLQV